MPTRACPTECRSLVKRGGHPPLPIFPETSRPYLIALSVIAAVQAPLGSLVMIFWASRASAVRL